MLTSSSCEESGLWQFHYCVCVKETPCKCHKIMYYNIEKYIQYIIYIYFKCVQKNVIQYCKDILNICETWFPPFTIIKRGSESTSPAENRLV